METPLKILVAEDDVGDIRLLQRAFAAAKVKLPVHFASDGAEVLNYLQGKEPFENPVKYPLPDLLLLDLGLPLISGFEIMAWLQEQPRFRRLPVIVFSNSDRPEDISRAHELGAASYVVKPQDPKELVRMVERLQAYWRQLGESPGRPAPRLVLSS